MTDDYHVQIVREASRALEDIRAENERLMEAARQDVYAKIPRIKEIDQDIRQTGLDAIAAVRSGVPARKAVSPIRKKIPALRKEKRELLKENGLPKDILDLRYNCKKCRDTGVLEASYCECRQEIIRRLTYKASGLGSVPRNNFSGFNIALYDDNIEENGISARKNAMHILEESLNFELGNILFYGGTGLGKTFLSECIADKWMQNGRLVCPMSAPTLFSMLEDNKFGRDSSPKTEQAIDMIYKADLLIIDDLGTEFRSSVTDTHLFKIINVRIQNDLSTIINTNMDLAEIAQNYSERIASRIFGEYKLFKFFGEDIRLKKRRKKSKK